MLKHPLSKFGHLSYMYEADSIEKFYRTVTPNFAHKCLSSYGSTLLTTQELSVNLCHVAAVKKEYPLFIVRIHPKFPN